MDVLSWHVHCVWPQQGHGGHAYIEAFTNGHPRGRAAMAQFTPSQQDLVTQEMARLVESYYKRGMPVGCDVLVVRARKP